MGWSPPSFGQAERPFDPEDPYADPAALIEQRIKKTHEKMVQIEKAKVIVHSVLSDVHAWRRRNDACYCFRLKISFIQKDRLASITDLA